MNITPLKAALNDVQLQLRPVGSTERMGMVVLSVDGCNFILASGVGGWDEDPASVLLWAEAVREMGDDTRPEQWDYAALSGVDWFVLRARCDDAAR
jgi:hypothetical protein